MKTTHYTRNFILNVWAEQPFWRFMALIVAAILVISFLFAFMFYSVGPIDQLHWRNLPLVSEKPFFPCLKRAFLGLVTLSDEVSGCPITISWLENVLSAVQILFGVFFFASIVAFFTGVVLRPKVIFKLKSCLNIKFLNGQARAYLSCYNASPTTISNLHIRMVARIRVNDSTLRNVVLYDGSPVHPLSEPYVPLRVSAPLGDNNISISKVDEDGFVSGICHQRAGDIMPLDLVEIYVNINGVLVGIEQAVHASARYLIGERGMYHGPFRSLEPDYEYARRKGMFTRLTPPVEISENFDFNAETLGCTRDKLYVFGYGSLVSPKSFSSSLLRNSWDGDDFPLATLRGYRRIWNVAMDNSKTISGYKRYSDVNDPQSFPACFVSFINIEESDADEITGVIAEVSENEMALLKKRERNYFLKEVTESILHAPVDGRVYTFIGSEEAKVRFDRGLKSNTSVISADYESFIEDAFRTRGAAAYRNYVDTTVRSSQLRVHKLQIHQL